MLNHMMQEGIATRSGPDGKRWFLTQLGMDNLKTCMQLGKPSPAFAVRRTLALEDMTSYELLALLDEDGWEWKARIPESQRTQRMKEIVHVSAI